MSLLDKSPGGFMAAAFAILYGVVLAETWMLTTDSLVAMGAVMALIVAVSGGLVRWMGALMGSEDYSMGEPAKAAAPAWPGPARWRPAPAASWRGRATRRRGTNVAGSAVEGRLMVHSGR
jgi:hypothetical protein